MQSAMKSNQKGEGKNMVEGDRQLFATELLEKACGRKVL